MAISRMIILSIISIISFAIISYLPIFLNLLLRPEELRIEDVSRYEQRFKSVKKVLPEHGVIGYRSDCNDMSDHCKPGFYLAQYALSPIILDMSPKHALVLGNFGNPGTTQESSGGDIKKLLTDSGNGVKLYLVDDK